MSITLLRTLTRKSILGFGHEPTMPVQYFLNCYKSIVLLNLYFETNRITFSEDILEEMGVTEQYRIKKPGSLRHNQLHPVLKLTAPQMITEILDIVRSRETKRETASKIRFFHTKKKIERLNQEAKERNKLTTRAHRRDVTQGKFNYNKNGGPFKL